MTQTGVAFSADIQNDEGFFSLGDVNMGGNPFLEIFADGYYFNEVTGEISNDRLALFALANTQTSDININILSHLERPRAKTLYAAPAAIVSLNPDGSLSNEEVRSAHSDSDIFEAAKSQAQQEVLAVFAIDATTLGLDDSEGFNISGTGEGDQILTAVSVILQAYRSVGEMTELLASLSDDLAPDGTLDSASVKNELSAGVSFVNTDEVTNNLIARFDTLDESNASGFVPYIENFLERGSADGGGPVFPQYGPVRIAIINGEEIYGDAWNVLSEELSCVNRNSAFYAEVPEGFSLKVQLTVTSGWVSWRVGTQGTGWDPAGGDSQPLVVEEPNTPLASMSNVGATQSFVTDLATSEPNSDITFEGRGTVEIAYFANGLEGAYLTRTLEIDNCERPIEVPTDNPEEPTTMAMICDYVDATVTVSCTQPDNPPQPELDIPMPPQP